MRPEQRLTELWIYPIKSIRGIALQTSALEARGLRHDRRWLLVDDGGNAITQREEPALASVVPALTDAGLQVTAPGRSPLLLAYPQPDEPSLTVRVWHSVCQALPVGAEADTWFSEYLGKSCRLVVMPETTHREISPNYTAGEGIVSFADGYPCLLTSAASLNGLNKRLPMAIPMNRFRPNLVVTGFPAYDEDNWRMVHIGAARFHVAKPCDRCVVTTIDQHTGLKTGPEPLRELGRYRKTDQGIIMGLYLIPLGDATLKVGDAVKIDRR